MILKYGGLQILLFLEELRIWSTPYIKNGVNVIAALIRKHQENTT